MCQGVLGQKRVHGWKRVNGTIEKEQAECMHHGVYGRKRAYGLKGVQDTIEKE